ncbi:pseudouridine synthase [Candidatus Peregrinibacteria bacterium CG11_big_fil_rev_8_21_14_0_20_46_8]|nr:MAG: pseudouridine synthase [Candidatus Peregrinibacteria bacterium CG11_big_fil_rev_8_21_14_0_20_46_8]
MKVRLHKYLADKGVASRRKAEQYIRDGLIQVNGKVVREMGVQIDPEKDRVEIDPSLPKLQEQHFVYYALHKPVGYVSTVSGKERPKVTELIKDDDQRLFPVGRLDKLTSGLLLMTNDGRLTYQLTHPKFEKEKEYVVKVRETITPKHLTILTEPFFIQGRKTQPPTIVQQSPHMLRIIIKEGRNRQIRRMCERANLHVEKLKRIRIGKIGLGILAPGEYRSLTKAELDAIGLGESAEPRR